MPSLRQRVTTYFRQLSFINEPRDDSRLVSSLSPRNHDDGCFITRYLEGRLDTNFGPNPEIVNGKDPSEMPDLPLLSYPIGSDSITAACTGPDEGLAGVKRSKLHLSAGPDIDFIDITQDNDSDIRQSNSNTNLKKQTISRYSIKQPSPSDKNANTSITTNKSSIKRGARKNSLVQQQNVDVKDITDKKSENNPKLEKTINVVVSLVSTKTKEGELISTKIITSNDKALIQHNDALNRNTQSAQSHSLRQSHASEPTSIRHTNMNNKTRSRPNSSELVHHIEIEPIAGVVNWKQENEHAYGLSISLYEKNPVTNEQAGNPVADCYGLVTRGNTAAMALADGVNWGEGARLAARSAVQGSLEYLNTAVFGVGPGGTATSTREVFVSLLRCFWEAHACILEVGGALSTLTVAVILPLEKNESKRYVVCACNVGDSLGYVYSKSNGVREFTQGSHDITSMRDMRDALGALGPVDGKDPELGNLTLSLTVIEEGDIVFLTSDGVSDNFDPVVGKFAEAFTYDSQVVVNEPKKQEPKEAKAVPSGLAPKRQNKSSSAIYVTNTPKNEIMKSGSSSKIGTMKTSVDSPPIRPARTKKLSQQPLSIHNPQQSTSSLAHTTVPSRPKYMRSQTVIEPRIIKSPAINFPKSAAGLPLVTGVQRHALTLLRLEDLLCYGINGTLRPCSSAKKLCHLLVDFVKMITSAKRKILEQRELFYKITSRPDGVRREIELNRLQQRSARKKVVEGSTFALLPGKLDHASVVAFTVGGEKSTRISTVGFSETNF